MSKKPTDAAIVGGFSDFEKGWNVWMAEYQHNKKNQPVAYHEDYNTMWAAHRAYRKRAIAAQERIDAKKAAKAEKVRDPIVNTVWHEVGPRYVKEAEPTT